MDILAESQFQRRKQASEARASVAKRWARKIMWFTYLLVLFAIWQNRELAPPVHDGIYVMADMMQDVMNGAPETQDTIRNMFNGNSAGIGNGSEFSAITQWLLDNR